MDLTSCSDLYGDIISETNLVTGLLGRNAHLGSFFSTEYKKFSGPVNIQSIRDYKHDWPLCRRADPP